MVAIGAVFTLARFSEAFLVLRAYQTGLPVAYAPLVLIATDLALARDGRVAVATGVEL